MKRHIAVHTWLPVPLLLALICSTSLAANEVKVRPVVAVLEFHDYSSYQEHLVGRRVADSLCAALTATGRWETVAPAAVRRAIHTMNLKPPFAVGYQQALAHAVNADMTVTGRVEGVKIDPAQGSVKVVLIADFIDRISGQSTMPVQVAGTAKRDINKPKPTDMIVEEALTQACQLLAEITRTLPLGLAEVTNVDGDELTLRADMNSSLVTGDRMLLFRKRSSGSREYELVACLMVNKLDGLSVRAKVLGKANDIYTGDLATCVGPARSGAER